MTTGQRRDPHLNYRFKLEIDSLISAGFQEATIPDSTQEPVEYREGTDPPFARKFAGLVKFGTITLKRGVTDSMELYNWRRQVEDGNLSEARRSVNIILLDAEGNDAARWELKEAWPSKYDSSDLSASGNEVMVETLELQIEQLRRIS